MTPVKTSPGTCPECGTPNVGQGGACAWCGRAGQLPPAAEGPAEPQPRPDTDAADGPVPSAEDAAPCAACGQPADQDRRVIPLCRDCRQSLSHRAVPLWVRAAGVVVGGYVAVSLIWLPAKLGAGIAFERGQRAEAAGEFARAASYYDATLEGVPDSTVALARSTITHWRAGERTQAARSLRQLEGRPLPSEVADDLRAMLKEMTGGAPRPGGR